MKKALKKIAVMVTIVALTMGNSVLSAAEYKFPLLETPLDNP